eukprot:m.198631 g.198631  ORF g.198631 m.198631 type:complete len:557 (-) comp15297_c3_seq2:163-1833(-)
MAWLRKMLAPKGKPNKTSFFIVSELEVPCQIDFIVYRRTDFIKRYKVTVDPLSQGEILTSHHSTLISIQYPCKTGAEAAVARQQWIPDEQLLSQFQLVLTSTEPRIANRGITTALRRETQNIVDREDLWHEIHITRDAPPHVIQHRGKGSPSPTPRDFRQSTASSADEGGAAANEPVRLHDPGPEGTALLDRARSLCRCDRDAAGAEGWSEVGTAPSLAEIEFALSTEFGRGVYLAHEAAVKVIVASEARERDPEGVAAAEAAAAAAAARRVMVRLEPWVDLAPTPREVPPAVTQVEAAREANPSVIAHLAFDFTALQRLLEAEHAEAERYRGVVETRDAEIKVGLAESARLKAAKEAEAKAKAAEAERTARVEALRRRQLELEEEERRRKAERARQLEAEAAERRRVVAEQRRLEEEARQAEEKRRREEAARVERLRREEEQRRRDEEERRECARLAEIARQREAERKARQEEADQEYARALYETEQAENLRREAERIEQLRRSRETAERLKREEQAAADEAAARRLYEEEQRHEQQLKEDRLMAQQLSQSWNPS